ncbi:LIC10906 family membrane protein [Leptospira yasudae]|uniref:Histidine kinase N-terminal 7TM region domain-containing protein n=1 Tax=Leptospira yasudae TaxID=2202201 RepID=A0A6N4R101_9LEPT|nr:histidine kinase N-terminal 7TM domain-containing protein [Leptospira yasudae]TGL81448.1 hypothetical protein EHQ72_05910 [Leptospira yasudae]TGL81709.1 hypothetical protein EHQ77_06450 [Leptospira yasudae]TGL88085.1 hypothetical protein EHQ83_03810 [Leptospira yasudae]
MDVIYYASLFCSFAVLFLGIYVFRVGEKRHPKIKPNFLALTFALALWLFGSGIRNLIPIDLIGVAPNWILTAVIPVPFLLKELTQCLLAKGNLKSKQFQILEFSFLGYLIIAGLSSNLIETDKQNISVFRPLFSYHLLIAYSIFYVGISIYWMLYEAIRSKGIVRVRSSLLVLGTLSGFLITILFVYILPLFGIFKGYLSSLGILAWVLFWAIAIVQYDAFETRAIILRSRFLAKREIPLLSRISFRPVLVLHSILDPLDYRLQLRNSRVEVVNYIMQYHMALLKESDMKYRTQIRRITSFIERYMK